MAEGVLVTVSVVGSLAGNSLTFPADVARAAADALREGMAGRPDNEASAMRALAGCLDVKASIADSQVIVVP